MTYISVKCRVCNCENMSKNGKSSSGKQQYICNNKNCTKSSFILDCTYNASKPKVKNKIIPMTINGSGIRDIARVLKISTNTVMSNLKKVKKTEKVLVDIVKIKKSELDKMWSFVKKKLNQRWLWYAINHETGEILEYALGKRKNSVFLKLKKLLKSFKIEMNYTDNWISYKKYINKNKHEVGKAIHKK